MSGHGGGSMYVDWKSRVIVDSRRFCEPARPAVGEVIRRGSGDMGRQTRKSSYKHDKLTQSYTILSHVYLSVS